MKVRVFGFTWETNPTNKLKNFLQFIQSQNAVELKSLSVAKFEDDYHRIVVLNEIKDDLWCGFLLTVKNSKKFIRSRKTSKGFKISTESIAKEDKFADINFFIEPVCN